MEKIILLSIAFWIGCNIGGGVKPGVETHHPLPAVKPADTEKDIPHFHNLFSKMDPYKK